MEAFGGSAQTTPSTGPIFSKARSPSKEFNVAIEHPRLKLGKSASFVKTKIKRAPREDESWEADSRALPKPAGPR
jgi:hypothetical protein